MFYKVVNFLKEKISDLLAIILFGSYARFGKGNDIDLVVIIERKLSLEEKANLEREITSSLNKLFNYKKTFDVHFFDLETFLKNLEPPNFLSGIFLGYEILYSKIDIKKLIEDKRKEINKYEFVDKYGVWHIG